MTKRVPKVGDWVRRVWEAMYSRVLAEGETHVLLWHGFKGEYASPKDVSYVFKDEADSEVKKLFDTGFLEMRQAEDLELVTKKEVEAKKAKEPDYCTCELPRKPGSVIWMLQSNPPKHTCGKLLPPVMQELNPVAENPGDRVTIDGKEYFAMSPAISFDNGDWCWSRSIYASRAELPNEAWEENFKTRWPALDGNGKPVIYLVPVEDK